MRFGWFYKYGMSELEADPGGNPSALGGLDIFVEDLQIGANHQFLIEFALRLGAGFPLGIGVGGKHHHRYRPAAHRQLLRLAPGDAVGGAAGVGAEGVLDADLLVGEPAGGMLPVQRPPGHRRVDAQERVEGGDCPVGAERQPGTGIEQ